MSLALAGALERVADEVDPQPHPLAYRPKVWVRDRLGEFVWSKQVDIMNSVRDRRYTAVPSCHGAGKSYIASVIAAWWIDTMPDPFVVTSAPSAHQVKSILWREIKRRQRKGRLDGHISESEVPEWKINGEQVAFGRKPADYVDEDKAATSFQGIHARSVLVILDEACGIPKWLWTAAESLITNEHSRMLAIGNPTDPASEFAAVCMHRDWHTIHISAFDLPAYTGEFAPAYLLDLLTGRLWVEERRRRWGEGSPMYIARVLGKFPDIADDQLLSPKVLRECAELELPGFGPGRYGLDVARLGRDMSVLYRNRDGVVRRVRSWGKLDNVELAEAVDVFVQPHHGAVPIIVDSIGVGAGVHDILKHKGRPVVSFDAGARARDFRRFANLRTEQWWRVKELAEAGALDLPSEEDDEDLIAELGAIRWDLDIKNRVRLEKKDETSKRVGHSPDHADACMMSTYEGTGIGRWLEEYAEPDMEIEAPITAGLLEEPF